jgi:hypothetical protein
MTPPRHCEPTGRRKAPPDDRLREAIQKPQHRLDCFVATLLAMTPPDYFLVSAGAVEALQLHVGDQAVVGGRCVDAAVRQQQADAEILQLSPLEGCAVPVCTAKMASILPIILS